MRLLVALGTGRALIGLFLSYAPVHISALRKLEEMRGI